MFSLGKIQPTIQPSLPPGASVMPRMIGAPAGTLEVLSTQFVPSYSISALMPPQHVLPTAQPSPLPSIYKPLIAVEGVAAVVQVMPSQLAIRPEVLPPARYVMPTA